MSSIMDKNLAGHTSSQLNVTDALAAAVLLPELSACTATAGTDATNLVMSDPSLKT